MKDEEIKNQLRFLIDFDESQPLSEIIEILETNFKTRQDLIEELKKRMAEGLSSLIDL